MLSKEEIKISEMQEYFDRHGRFPFEKQRLDITLESSHIIKLKTIAKNQNTSVSSLIANALTRKGYV